MQLSAEGGEASPTLPHAPVHRFLETVASPLDPLAVPENGHRRRRNANEGQAFSRPSQTSPEGLVHAQSEVVDGEHHRGAVGNHHFRSMGRCGGPEVGDEIGDADVGFVANRAHHGHGHRRDGAGHLFVVEGHEVFGRTATAPDNHHRCPTIGLQQLQGGDDFGWRFRPLHPTRRQEDGDARKALTRDPKDVLKSRPGGACRNTDCRGKRGERPLAGGIEQTFGGQLPFRGLDAGLQVALACSSHAPNHEVELTTGRVQVERTAHHHNIPHGRTHPAVPVAPSEHHRTDGGLGVFQREVPVAGPRRRELRDFSLHPDRADFCRQDMLQLERKLRNTEHIGLYRTAHGHSPQRKHPTAVHRHAPAGQSIGIPPPVAGLPVNPYDAGERSFMPTDATVACERCGRTVSPAKGCPNHRGARLLDLRREDDRAWRDEVVKMRRHRHFRLGTAVAGTVGMVAGIISLTNLVASGTGAVLSDGMGMASTLGAVLYAFSAALIVGGIGWGSIGAIQAARRLIRRSDSIERQAATRELVRRVTALTAAIVFALAVVVLRDRLHGVPAELAAAAVALIVAPPLQSILEFWVDRKRLLANAHPEPTSLLPPVAAHTPADSRAHDPLEQARRSTLRTTIMDRR